MAATGTDTNLHLYLDQISKTDLLTPEQERELGWRIINDKCGHSRQSMIAANLRLVVSVAKQFNNRGLPLSDLIEEGNLGLIRAVEGYDPAHGARFSTYATWWIKKAIRRLLHNSGPVIRLPHHLIERITKWRAIHDRLERHLHRRPTPAEFASAAEIDPSRIEMVNRILRLNRRPSNNQVDSGGSELNLLDLVEDRTNRRPEIHAQTAEQKHRLQDSLHLLDPRTARIVRLRYGLDGTAPQSLRQVGEVVGLTRERVRQIELAALRRLRQLIDSDRPISQPAPVVLVHGRSRSTSTTPGDNRKGDPRLRTA